ncbi:plasmid partitioning/stability family protein [Acerihabitans sp. TG2]|uniref:plasmid partitioning/stability family protein n=1 Tax=Acerihabitans sp. TG2 TaxID=3096008 RepID=UPI002B23107E|nr:plasmid partitioning/stability family protein [Acerihabitans sp. TG2]MEA9392661.1 plasmid partitioning/stability family protein [Acerihabitans sp. TG2]
MTDKRKKLTIYLHPDDDGQDAKALEVIESVPLRTRGDFFRASVVGGCALYQLDKRLPYLLAMLFDGRLTADQLVGIIEQTTGWQPSTASIRDVIAACGGNIPDSPSPPVQQDGGEGAGKARDNFKRILKKN